MDKGYYVGWGSLALINAGLAQSKNKSGMAWFLLSLLLGPVATFILVISGKTSKMFHVEHLQKGDIEYLGQKRQ